MHFKYNRDERNPNIWLLDLRTSNLSAQPRMVGRRYFLDGDLFNDGKVTIVLPNRWFVYPVEPAQKWEAIKPPVRITVMEWREPADLGELDQPTLASQNR